MGSRHLTDPSPRQVRDLLRLGRERLGSAGRLDAEVLLAHVLGLTRSGLIVHDERPVSEEQARGYRGLLERRAAGEPLAYLTGSREFWSLPLAVTPAVLIPRPETELLVERVLALGAEIESARGGPPAVLELGSGSGAIALALARSASAWAVTAVERSAAALQVARHNAAELGLTRIEWLEGDWLAPVAGRCFGIICSNPPYVAAADPALAALHHEPMHALVAGPTGMEALGAIAAAARDHLAPGGYLVLEHGSAQAAELAKTLVAAGYARVVCHRDLAGRDRVTEAQWGP